MNMNINKILFFDLETSSKSATYDDLTVEDPKLSKLWADWQEKYKESNGDLTLNQLWENKAALHAEYAKVICATFGYYDKNMDLKLTSYYGHDEKDILLKCVGVLNNADKNGMSLGGHSIERFDVPFLWKRMLANGLNPPAIISIYDKKPWELRFFDVAKIWSNGSWKESFTSLDTMCAVLGVASPKGELKGPLVHDAYWNKNNIEGIKTYCEQDVESTAEVGKKLIEITSKQNAYESVVH